MITAEAWQAINTFGLVVLGLLQLWTKKAAGRAASAASKARENTDANIRKLDDVHQKIDGGVSQAIAEAEERGRRTSPPQILIVDDDPNDLELMSRALKHLDADVYCLLSDEGVDTLIRSRISSARGYPFDFVLVDLRMPQDASENVLRLFKTMAPGVRRCIITGRISPGHMDSLRPFEPYTFLTKPLDLETAQELFTEMHIPFRRHK